MSSKKTWDNCQLFDTNTSCPNGKDEFMKQFRYDVSIGQGYRKILDNSKGTEINKRFCHNCNLFRPKST